MPCSKNIYSQIVFHYNPELSNTKKNLYKWSYILLLTPQFNIFLVYSRLQEGLHFLSCKISIRKNTILY